MAWKVESMVEHRLQFVLRYRDGERMSDLCREYEISRKTGYKFWQRFLRFGLQGLEDRSRRPKTLGQGISHATEQAILDVRFSFPSWGARKIRAYLLRNYPNISVPSKNTIHTTLKRYGFVRKNRVRPRRSDGGSP